MIKVDSPELNMITREDLKGATEILCRLADNLHKPDAQGYVRIPFQKKFFGTIQKLMKGTEWEGRYCWELTGGCDVMLAVDVKPLPVMVRCRHCDGNGIVEEKREDAKNHHRR